MTVIFTVTNLRSLNRSLMIFEIDSNKEILWQLNQLSNDDEILSNEALKPLLRSLCLEEQAEYIVRKTSRHPNNLGSRPQKKKKTHTAVDIYHVT